jgi:hypothetical protein
VELRAVDAAVPGQRGRNDEVWPLPEEVKEAIDYYIQLDRKLREIVYSRGEDFYLFQPRTN